MENIKHIRNGVWNQLRAPDKNDANIYQGSVGYSIHGTTYGIICQVFGKTEEQAKAHIDLIAEAGTVANETGLAPRQLLEQRNELLEALKLTTLCSDYATAKANYGGGANHWTTVVEKAISKATE